MGNFFGFSKPPKLDIIEAVESIQKEKGVPIESAEMQQNFEEIYNRAFQSLVKAGANPCEYYNRDVYHCIKDSEGKIINCTNEVKRYEKCVNEVINEKIISGHRTGESASAHSSSRYDSVGLMEVKLGPKSTNTYTTKAEAEAGPSNRSRG